jgi:ElaB/YqjD/DUF883 family membrane-anchored ribosome-binding protein
MRSKKNVKLKTKLKLASLGVGLGRTKFMTKQSSKSILSALNELDQAIEDGGNNIKEVVYADFQKLKSALTDASPNLQGAFNDIKDESIRTLNLVKDKVGDSTRVVADEIDRSVRENPWKFVGAAACVATLVGFWLGMKAGGSESATRRHLKTAG